MGFKKGHGYLGTEETKKRVSLALTGIKRSAETRLKMSLGQRGNKHTLGMKHSEETKKKIGLANSGRLKGRKLSKETCQKMSIARRGKYLGAESSNWKGGVTPKNLVIRMTGAYREWRTAVFTRDLFTCQECKQIGGQLNADHIKPFSKHPELRFDVNNGRTLCVPCHRKTDTYGSKANRKDFKKVYGI